LAIASRSPIKGQTEKDETVGQGGKEKEKKARSGKGWTFLIAKQAHLGEREVGRIG